MNNTQNTIDAIENMLAHLVCADQLECLNPLSVHKQKQLSTSVDAGAKLRFNPIYPSVAFTTQIGTEREFALNANLLLHTPQDLLGSKTEVALVSTDFVKWSAFKKIFKRPIGVWVEKPGADLYEYHSRFIRADGSADYCKRVAAIDKKGNPVRVVITGTHDQSSRQPDGELLILAASIVEDANRPGTFQTTVSDGVGVILPVPQGEHLDIFRLRDSPCTAGGRRKPLLHWVAKHLRKTAKAEVEVKEHLRGVHQFGIDGLRVTLNGGSN